MSLKAVLFDLDDTLYDQQHNSRSALKALYDRYPVVQSVTFEEFEEQHIEFLERYHLRVLSGEMTLDQARFARFRGLLSLHEPNPDFATVYTAQALYRETYLANERLIAGTVPLLERLRADGLTVGLLTNSTVVEQTGKIQRLGLVPLLDVVVISEAVGCAKPDPRIFTHTLEKLNCSCEDVIMVGDSWANDILGARAVGIRAVWLNRYGRACPDASLAHEITALEPLETILNLLN